jgi:tRNA-dihydrouridine synthase B
MKIGSLDLGERPLLLAPMEDVTEPSFRYMCKKYGADMMYTEFASSDALVRNVNKTMNKLDIFSYERPVGIQIFGRDTESMVQAAKIAEAANPDVIDINFGCPVKKVACKGSGAGMLQNIPKMLEITGAIVKAVNIPVTVKTRLGWDETDKPIVELAEMLQDTGIQALTVHGRTRAQMYKGEADWTLIGRIKDNPRMRIPIIGNGDIDTPQKALDAFARYGVDGVMIGRGSIGRPWIFREVKHFLATGQLLPAPSLDETATGIIEFMRKSIERMGPRSGVVHMRRQFATAFKGLDDFRETRIKLLNTNTQEEAEEVLKYIVDRWGGQ